MWQIFENILLMNNIFSFQRENVLTIPNILCVTRIAMSPYLGYVILQDRYHLALGLLVFAGITDLVRNIIVLLFTINIMVNLFCICNYYL